MLIGLIVSSLVLKINDSELYYSEPTKCSKRTLNTTRMLTDQIICSLCFVGIQGLTLS